MRNTRYTEVIILLLLVFLSCKSANKTNACLIDQLDEKSIYFYDQLKKDSTFFVIKNGHQVEYFKGKPYVEAQFLKRTCSAYSIIYEKVYNSDGMHVGDTVDINILKVNKDTFTFRAFWHGRSMETFFIKGEK